MGDRNLAGHRPHKGRHFAGDRNYYLIDVLTSSHQAAIAFAQAHLGFPTDLLDRFGHGFQSELQVATHLGRVAIGPRAFDEDTTGMRVAGFRDSPLASPLSRGVLTRNEAQVTHQLPWGGKTMQVAQFRD